MTAQQAQAEINKCEQDIIRAHSALCNAAKNVGESAKECARGGKTRKTLMPLIISLIGVFLSSFLGFFSVVLVIAGIIIAYTLNQSATAVVNNIDTAQKRLYSTIDSNSVI